MHSSFIYYPRNVPYVPLFHTFYSDLFWASAVLGPPTNTNTVADTPNTPLCGNFLPTFSFETTQCRQNAKHEVFGY